MTTERSTGDGRNGRGPAPQRSGSSPGGPSEREVRSQRQARALGDPTRYSVYRAVVDAPAPIDVATLTARFGLNHNAIRQHLAKLCDAGLIVEAVAARPGPGRPRLQYHAALAADTDWGIPSAYEELSLMLLELVRSGRGAREVGADAGRRMAAGIPDAADPVDRIEANAVKQGFEPRRVASRSGTELILARCPFQAAAGAAPEVICELHRGLAEGIAEAAGGTVEIVDLVARDPSRAGCRLKMRPATD